MQEHFSFQTQVSRLETTSASYSKAGVKGKGNVIDSPKKQSPLVPGGPSPDHTGYGIKQEPLKTL
jgi:hypothetical protein